MGVSFGGVHAFLLRTASARRRSRGASPAGRVFALRFNGSFGAASSCSDFLEDEVDLPFLFTETLVTPGFVILLPSILDCDFSFVFLTLFLPPSSFAEKSVWLESPELSAVMADLLLRFCLSVLQAADFFGDISRSSRLACDFFGSLLLRLVALIQSLSSSSSMPFATA